MVVIAERLNYVELINDDLPVHESEVYFGVEPYANEDIARALCASCCIPALVKPVEWYDPVIKKDFLKYIPLFIIAIVVFVIFFVNYEIDCGNDQYCFMRAAKKCDSATLSINKEENTFTYRLVNGDKDSCIVEVTASSVNGDMANKNLFEGKTMLCDVPKEELS